MADPKKPSDSDDDRTMVDIRPPDRPAGGDDEGDKTMVAPVSRPPAAPPADEDRTMVAPRSRPVVQDEDRTMIAPRGGMAPPDPGDRTVIRPSGGGGAPAASGGGAYQVVCLSGDARGRRFPIADAEALIGSSPNCNVVLPGTDGIHAKLVRTPEGYDLQNLSTPGSVLLSGGRRVTRAKLSSGDLVKIGGTVVRFVQPGDLFSSEYSEADFAGGGFASTLREKPLYLVVAAALLVVGVVVLWPSKPAPKKVVAKADGSKADERRKQEVQGLLTAGEVLFNAGKLMAPADQPEAENAFSKFNEALALDPGNAAASQWLKRIDEERDRQRRAREEEEQRRLAAERERKEKQRRALEEKVNVILAQGDALFDKGQVTEPTGQNALARYREALELDPENAAAQERVQRAVTHYVDRGDQFREKNDLWNAIENYRKASRATGGKDEEVERRIREVEITLKSGFAGTGSRLIMYKDDRGQLFVFDEVEKVPARYRDRAIEVNPVDSAPKGRGR